MALFKRGDDTEIRAVNRVPLKFKDVHTAGRSAQQLRSLACLCHTALLGYHCALQMQQQRGRQKLTRCVGMMASMGRRQ